MVEKVSPDEFPPGRIRRYPEIDTLEVGEVIFIPDTDSNTSAVDITTTLRSILWYRGKILNRKFQTRRGMYKAHLGTFVKRLK